MLRSPDFGFRKRRGGSNKKSIKERPPDIHRVDGHVLVSGTLLLTRQRPVDHLPLLEGVRGPGVWLAEVGEGARVAALLVLLAAAAEARVVPSEATATHGSHAPFQRRTGQPWGREPKRELEIAEGWRWEGG